jgi:hypothetical protein
MNDSTIRIRINPALPAIIGLSLIIGTIIVSSAIIKIRGYGQTISVTGAAFKPITSDYAMWEASLQTTSADLVAGYAKLKKDLEELRAFLKDQGFGENDYQLGTVQINKSSERPDRPASFTLVQTVRFESPDVARLTALSQQASALIEKGIELMSRNPRYLCTKLENLKIEMIKATTENARLRADQLAQTTGRKVGAPSAARVGVFQIRPLNSQEVSDYGMSDVTAIEKEIVCTVQISFLIE